MGEWAVAVRRCREVVSAILPYRRAPAISQLRCGLLAECHRGSARNAGLSDHLAERPRPAHRLHAEFAGRPHQGQRRDRSRGHQRRGQRLRHQHDRRRARYQWLLRRQLHRRWQFYPLTPCRMADTRNANGDSGRAVSAGGVERDFPVLDSHCDIPDTRRRPIR